MRGNNHVVRAMAALLGLLAISTPVLAAEADKPEQPDKLQVKPILDGRLRYETVDQGPLEADALSLRLRAGAEARLGEFSFLAEVG